MKAFDELLPPHWSHNNPIDILGDAEPRGTRKSLEIAAKDENADGMLVITCSAGHDESDADGRAFEALRAEHGKTGDGQLDGRSRGGGGQGHPEPRGHSDVSLPGYRGHGLQLHVAVQLQPARALRNAEAARRSGRGPDRAKAKRYSTKYAQSGRTILTEFESKELLSAYGIPTVATTTAAAEEEAVKCADEIGYPVVLKLYSETITHKTDVGGVQLNLRDAEAVRAAYRQIKKAVTEKAGAEHFQGVTVQPMIKLDGYELILGSSIDPQFGPVLLFGTGGQLVEVFKDRALALPPLNTTLARRMIEQTKVFAALKGVRGRKPVDIAGLEDLLVRFSQLVVEQPWIKEIDINPLLASPERLLALDARVVLHEPEVKEENCRSLAIRPYPMQYVGLEDEERRERTSGRFVRKTSR